MNRPPPKFPPFPNTTLSRPAGPLRECLAVDHLHYGHRRGNDLGPRQAGGEKAGEDAWPKSARLEGLYTPRGLLDEPEDRKSTRLNTSHGYISYAVFCLKKEN